MTAWMALERMPCWAYGSMSVDGVMTYAWSMKERADGREGKQA